MGLVHPAQHGELDPLNGPNLIPLVKRLVLWIIAEKQINGLNREAHEATKGNSKHRINREYGTMKTSQKQPELQRQPMGAVKQKPIRAFAYFAVRMRFIASAIHSTDHVGLL